MQYNLNPIQSDIYSAGNVDLNSVPFTRYNIEVQARNRARDDAFQRSFQELGARMTPAGMDGVDIDNFMKRKKEWQDYVVKNEEAYKNPAKDNGQVYGEAMRRYNDVLGVIQQSKDKLEALKPLQQIYADPNKRELITEQTVTDAHRATLPINDPNYKRFDVNSINFNPQPFDQVSENRFLDQVKQNVTGEKVYGDERIDAKTKTKISPFTIKINPDDYGRIRNYATDLVRNDSKAAAAIDNINATQHDQLNQTYKKYFGKDANIVTREDAATAWTMDRLDMESKGEEKSSYTPPSAGGSSLLGLRELLKDQKDERDFQTLVNVYNSKKTNGKVSTKSIGGGEYLSGTILNFTPAELAKFGKGINKIVEYDDGTIEAYQMAKNSRTPVKTFPITQADVFNVIGDELNLGARMSGAMGYATDKINREQPQQSTGGYTNITETNKGKIGVKNGKWYDIKTGKEIK